MRNGIVHHKSDRKSCVIPTADRNKKDQQNEVKLDPFVSCVSDLLTQAILYIFAEEMHWNRRSPV